MAGDEAGHPPGPFAEAFEIAAAAGLGCTCHAGEWAGPESVRAAMELPITRISHGVRAIEDPALVEEIADRGLVLECCPTSNVVLGIYPSYAEHPLPQLVEAGVRVTLGSDDPPYFGATIGGEYKIAAEELHFGQDDLIRTTLQAIDAAFCENGVKGTLRARVESAVGSPDPSVHEEDTRESSN